ncbi:MAG: adenylyl-sulfate kinase [Bacteroidetes bacterium 4484_276]|nr:MAG: adenylyl-sulfate kinase [Bacteroidetes bacterium 4484_276]
MKVIVDANMDKEKNIHPVFDQILTREDKERLLRQRSKVVWFTGLSGSGKTTLATELEKRLNYNGYLTQILDGDNIRSGINNNLGFSEEDRMENIRRISEVTKLLIHSGVIPINSFISPTREIRHRAREIIGKENFIEIYVSTPLEVCEQRDVKGLYKKAREGVIKDFTGIDSPFEPPLNPDVDIDTSALTVEECNEKILNSVLPKITYWK